MPTYVIASRDGHELVCDTGDLKYVPDSVANRYGCSDRLPYEDCFLKLMDFFRSRYPSYKIFTLGTSLVSGEKFVTYLTVCELEIQPKSFEKLRKAVTQSDRAIREKIGSMWEWGCCAIDGDRAVLVILWLDFAYFLQHRRDFINSRHNRFMAAFAPKSSKSTDYKVLPDGEIIEFDPQDLAEDEQKVFERACDIRFQVVQRESLSMV